jgi:hypothetical protein
MKSKVSMFVLFFLLLNLFVIENMAFPQSVGVVCITSGSALVVRTKCKKGETKASLSAFAKKGEVGDQGPAGVSPILARNVAFSAKSVNMTANVIATVEEFCPAGQVTIGGGCTTSDSSIFLAGSYPFDGTPQSWRCAYMSTSNKTVTITPLAVCANPG